MNWILNRLKEKSTYAGVFVLISIFAGYSVPEEWQPMIMQIGTGIGALAAIILKEKGQPTVVQSEPVEHQRIVTPDLTADQIIQRQLEG